MMRCLTLETCIPRLVYNLSLAMTLFFASGLSFRDLYVELWTALGIAELSVCIIESAVYVRPGL